MPNQPPPTGGPGRPGTDAPRWWPVLSYVLLGLGILGSVSGASFWAGRHSRAEPLEFVSPTATPPAPVTAYIAGQVVAPGTYALPPASRLNDLVSAAGGVLPDGDVAALNLAAKLADGQMVVVPAFRRPRVGASTADAAPVTGGEQGHPLNLNTASPSELAGLPRIGPATAAAIVDWRDRNGGFKSVDDLLLVRGIGEVTLEALRPYVIAP